MARYDKQLLRAEHVAHYAMAGYSAPVGRIDCDASSATIAGAVASYRYWHRAEEDIEFLLGQCFDSEGVIEWALDDRRFPNEVRLSLEVASQRRYRQPPQR